MVVPQRRNGKRLAIVVRAESAARNGRHDTITSKTQALYVIISINVLQCGAKCGWRGRRNDHKLGISSKSRAPPYQFEYNQNKINLDRRWFGININLRSFARRMMGKTTSRRTIGLWCGCSVHNSSVNRRCTPFPQDIFLCWFCFVLNGCDLAVKNGMWHLLTKQDI